jgi:putative chitinase
MVTLELLQALCPNTKSAILASYVDSLNEVSTYYEMDQNPVRLAGFLAQVAHESGGFNFIKENLNYGVSGLRNTFKKYFPTEADALPYQRNPAKIANKVYADRMGNGNEASGDGYKFCGRGLIQLTGRDNYTKLADALSISIEEVVAYLETPEGACASAGWFWDNNSLNSYCDRNDFVGLTKRINGGTNGLADRQHHFEIALRILQE